MTSPIIVLKFGGSVLRDADDLHRLSSVVERWRRRGYQVVCVVSAYYGSTDCRIAELGSAVLDPHEYANALTEGERSAARDLAATLLSRGAAAQVMQPHSIGLVATGPALDATPTGLSPAPLQDCLASDAVAIIPGFGAIDSHGRSVLLGRGGSDLTALFLASELKAKRCVLIKDVDGLYERDPAVDPEARRFVQANWESALATDGSILQHAALQFAIHRNQRFEVGSISGSTTTLVGTTSSTLASATLPQAPIDVALLGFGTVGSAVWSELQRFPDRFRVREVAVRRPRQERDDLRDIWTCDPVLASGRGFPLVIDCMGSTDVALRCADAALSAGSHFVSADKVLGALHGERLRGLARARGASFACSAAVGGAVPVLERLTDTTAVKVRAVLNGTANYVLQAVGLGRSLEQALADARAAGYAEADPSRDLEGIDAAHKLAILSATAGFGSLAPSSIPRTIIDGDVTPGFRQVAELHRTPAGPRARVSLQELQPGDPLGTLPGAWNGCEWTDSAGKRHWLRGQGAGGQATATAVLADAQDAWIQCQSARERTKTRPRETHRRLA